jgi:hypothetical protein
MRIELKLPRASQFAQTRYPRHLTATRITWIRYKENDRSDTVAVPKQQLLAIGQIEKLALGTHWILCGGACMHLASPATQEISQFIDLLAPSHPASTRVVDI